MAKQDERDTVIEVLREGGSIAYKIILPVAFMLLDKNGDQSDVIITEDLFFILKKEGLIEQTKKQSHGHPVFHGWVCTYKLKK